MRVKVRSLIDTDQAVNLKELKPLEKITVGLISQWHQNKFYLRMKNLKHEQEMARVAKMDEQLKDVLLTHVYAEFSQNRSLAKQGCECQTIVLSVNSAFRESLDRIRKHKDFLPFNLELVEENEDLRKCFSNMDILLKVTRKTVGGDNYVQF